MKRWIAAILALTLLLAAFALAEEDPPRVYANRDSLKIYAAPSKDSKVSIKVKGGAELVLENNYGAWTGVYFLNSLSQLELGYAESKYLTPTMPQKYCDHSWSGWTVVQAPTCTEKGLASRECPICGKTQTQDIKKNGHSFGEWEVLEEPACDASGKRVRVCAVCGFAEVRLIDPIPHEFGEWTVLRQATCTQPGLRSHECEECGYVEEEETELADHEYGSWTLISEPTCLTSGQRARRCMLCGASDIQVLDPLPHEYGEWSVTRQASCTAAGERARTCLFCGTRQTEAIDPLPHDYGEWTVARESSCTMMGLRVRTCRLCGAEQTQDIAMLPHAYSWTITVAATDHSAGVRALSCDRCGAVSQREDFDPEGTLRKGARGEAVRQLQQLLIDQGYLGAGGADGSFGGGTERAVIQFQRDQGLNPDGVAWPQTQQRLRHDFGEWQAVRPLTRDGDGEYQRVCKDCGYAEKVTLPAAKPILRRQKGEDVRVTQRMLNDLGYNCGTADGDYGPKLDNAYGAFAAEHGVGFDEGRLAPANVDALANVWIADRIGAGLWRGQSGKDSPVRLILTLTRGDGNPDGAASYEWKLTNMGSEKCRVVGVLMGFGDGHDFTGNNLVVALDGTVLNRDGGNSASGSFSASEAWGTGAPRFCAIGISEKTGELWLSNIRGF